MNMVANLRKLIREKSPDKLQTLFQIGMQSGGLEQMILNVKATGDGPLVMNSHLQFGLRVNPMTMVKVKTVELLCLCNLDSNGMICHASLIVEYLSANGEKMMTIGVIGMITDWKMAITLFKKSKQIGMKPVKCVNSTAQDGISHPLETKRTMTLLLTGLVLTLFGGLEYMTWTTKATGNGTMADH